LNVIPTRPASAASAYRVSAARRAECSVARRAPVAGTRSLVLGRRRALQAGGSPRRDLTALTALLAQPRRELPDVAVELPTLADYDELIEVTQ